jgi:hypothetical protein
MKLIDWLHHRRLLFQYDHAYKSAIAVLNTGEHIDIQNPPRYRQRLWELDNSQEVDSRQIRAIIDPSEYGY